MKHIGPDLPLHLAKQPSDKSSMKALSFFIVFTFFFAVQSHARSVEMTAEQFMKKGIPYCTKKIKRGCVQPKDGNTAKYYLTPNYQEKPLAAKKSKVKSKSASKKMAKHKSKGSGKSLTKNRKSSLPKYSKSKQNKRDIASVLEQRLKNHRKKKIKK